jgi:hypothetical protein
MLATDEQFFGTEHRREFEDPLQGPGWQVEKPDQAGMSGCSTWILLIFYANKSLF